jgi:hypothetical protein
MDSDGGVHIVVSVGELNGFLVVVGVGADGYPGGHGSGDASFDNAVNVVRQLLEC